MPDSPRIKLARLVYRLLNDPRGISYQELKDHYEIESTRTLRTYIEALKEIPELGDSQGNTQVEVGGNGDARRVYLRPLGQEPDDPSYQIVSLYFALSMLQFLEETELKGSLEVLYGSIFKGKSKSLFLNLDKKIYSINEWPKDYSRVSKILRDCLHSLIHQKALKTYYKSPARDQAVAHEIHPYTLLQYCNGLYIVGKSDQSDSILTFALERITKTKKEGKQYHYPSDYAPDKYIDGAFGLIRSGDERYKVVINFDPILKAVITSRKWHKASKVKELKNGSLQLSMTVSSLVQVAPWVLSYGVLAHVKKPEKLKDQIKETMASLAKEYELNN